MPDILNVPSQLAGERISPLVLPWPRPSRPDGFLAFDTEAEWRRFVSGLSLTVCAPDVVAQKFLRAQKLFYLAWIDFDLIKASELVALTALELALVNRYGKKRFPDLLKHLCDADGLTDAKLPMITKYGGTVVGRLTGSAKPTLAEIRNSLAHGDPFDALPYAGLLELVRDLIDYANRERI